MSETKNSNLFWRLMHTERSSAEGHEDFVTEAFAAVLLADQNLTQHFVNSILGVKLNQLERVVVETQSEYDSVKAGISRPDMEFRSESFVLFVENKIGASLNNYLIESSTENDEKETWDQVKKYDTTLQLLGDLHPSERYLIAIGQVPLKSVHADLTYFKGGFLWWDVFRIINEYYENSSLDLGHDSYQRWLINEFLVFMQITHLDPPKKLCKSKFSTPDAVRLLAEAIIEAGNYIKVSKVQNNCGFKLFMAKQNFTIWFDNDPASIRAFKENAGALIVPTLDDSFWYADVSDQKSLLAKIVRNVEQLEHDDSVPVSLADALAQFGNREIARSILDAILERWPQSPSTGKKSSKVKEISCVVGSITVRLAPYKSYERVILNTKVGNEKVHLARRLLKELFEYSEPGSELRVGHVNMPLDLVPGPVELNQLMDVIEQLACAPNDGWLD